MSRSGNNLTRNHGVVGSVPGLTQWVKDLALLWLWCSPVATPQHSAKLLKLHQGRIQEARESFNLYPLPWESPYATGAALKSKKQKTTRNRLMNIENRPLVAKREQERSGIDGEFGVSSYKLLHLAWVSSEALQYSTGNSMQSLGMDMMEDNVRKRIHIYTWIMLGSPCCTADIGTAL